MTHDQKVGYGRPPKHTRFQKGQSGNPKGRPKGARGSRIPALNEERMKSLILEEAYRMIAIRDNNRLSKIPVIQAILRSIALQAARGHQKSQQIFIELLRLVERENKALHNEWVETMIKYKVEGEQEIKRRKKCGEKEPEMFPHPDDIIVNLRTGEVEICGPMTKEEKPLWDQLRKCKRECNN